MAREFARNEISSVALVSGKPPAKRAYPGLLARDFIDWRLVIDGLVEKAVRLSLAELKSFPVTSQITEQTCEEGWCFIAEWTGVRLSEVLKAVGAKQAANFVAAIAYDGLDDSIDMADAWHSQTLIAYKKNGEDLSPDCGAPARLMVPRQLGYKSVKFLGKLTLVDTMKNIGRGVGSSQPDFGYSWYAGI